MSEQSCGEKLPRSKCVPINRCTALLDNPLNHSIVNLIDNPMIQSFVCGFNEDSKLLMVCCPYGEMADPQVRFSKILSNLLYYDAPSLGSHLASTVSHLVRRGKES